MAFHIDHQAYLCLGLFLFPYVNSQLAVITEVSLKSQFGTLIGTREKVTTTIASRNKESIEETEYIAFRGVPYAERPGRWQESIVKTALKSEFRATQEGSACPQWQNVNGRLTMIGDEDCLYASIFVPVKTDPVPLLKFMVYIHGGGFVVNADMNRLPISLLHQKNTIVVLFNYRLSVFGFLSTGTPHLPGNYAFFDQITMLKWIQKYGRDFGGDVNDVTIFGSSVGSVSIHYLLLSNLAKGLFHKAIMESGSALCERSMVPNPRSISAKVATQLNCPVEVTEEMVACLQKKSTLDLMTAGKNLLKAWSLPTVLGLVLDTYSRPAGFQFLPNVPEISVVVNKVPVMLGIASNEGLTAFVKLSKGFTYQELRNGNSIQSKILPFYLDLITRERSLPCNRSDFIMDLSQQLFHFHLADFRNDSIATLIGILGDIWINSCHKETVQQLCLNSVPVVYSYLFSHRDPDISPSYMESDVKSLEKKGIRHFLLHGGVSHTEEILYLLAHIDDVKKGEGLAFGHSIRNREMTEMLSKLWTDFATSSFMDNRGNGRQGQSWVPACSSADFAANEISLDRKGTVRNFREKEAAFWRKVHVDTLLNSFTKVNVLASWLHIDCY